MRAFIFAIAFLCTSSAFGSDLPEPPFSAAAFDECKPKVFLPPELSPAIHLTGENGHTFDNAKYLELLDDMEWSSAAEERVMQWREERKRVRECVAPVRARWLEQIAELRQAQEASRDAWENDQPEQSGQYLQLGHIQPILAHSCYMPNRSRKAKACINQHEDKVVKYLNRLVSGVNLLEDYKRLLWTKFVELQ